MHVSPPALRRELLLCLLGHGGDIFFKLDVKMSEPAGAAPPPVDPYSTTRFELHQGVVADACELAGVRTLLPLASCYCGLDEFSRLRWGGTDSLYRSALCEAVAGELAAYRAAVVAVEEDLLRDPHLPLVYVREKLLPFEPVFASVLAAVREVVEGGLVGGPLLARLHAGCLHGSPAVQQCFDRLLHRCHQVLYNQLVCWVVYGRLPPGSQECFISERAERAALHSPAKSDAEAAVLDTL